MPAVTVEQVRPHISLITLNRPDHLNALNFEIVEDLYRALDEVRRDNDCWVAVLTGAGRGFCSGLELKTIDEAPGLDGMSIARRGMRAMERMAGIVPAMRAIPQPVVAAVNGPAYGGGMCIALAAEVRVAGEAARFCAAAIRNGLTGCELGISYLLPRAIGPGRASELLLTGETIDARSAERIGLVNRVVPTAQVLDSAIETAEAMCRWSPFGVWMTKEVIWANLESTSLSAAMDLENRSQILAGHTGNLNEARAAFKEKRQPVYEQN